MNPKDKAGGWIMAELLFATVAGIALAAMGWLMFDAVAQSSENRQKANTALLEVAAFISRAQTGGLRGEINNNISMIVEGPGFDLSGGTRVTRGPACWLDSGDRDFKLIDTANPWKDLVANCSPCLNSSGLTATTDPAIMGTFLSATGTGMGTARCRQPNAAGHPGRCSTQTDMRRTVGQLKLPDRSLVRTPRNAPLRQGIWIPADSYQDAIEILHLIRSAPHYEQLPEIRFSYQGTTNPGLLLCI